MSAEVRRSAALWAPDELGPIFDPINNSLAPGLLEIHDYVAGYSKRTLLGGYLPVADIGVWNPNHRAGYEVIVLLPEGKAAKPIARLRYLIPDDHVVTLESQIRELRDDPDLSAIMTSASLPPPSFVKDSGQTYVEAYWNGSAEQFYGALGGIWSRWHVFHDEGMQVDIPDEWLLNAARAGLTLTRCSYRGLEPTYQVGEGQYTAFRAAPDCAKGSECPEVPFSDALFPVSHYEFVWAHQLWNHCEEGDRYFDYYLKHFILPSGDFLYNTQDQVEAPLNIGVFLAISARSYFYRRNLAVFEDRLPILDRMIRFALNRYEYSKSHFPHGDRRRGLIWGSPEADLGIPTRDGPDDHPYY
jgi:hypothetical protein